MRESARDTARGRDRARHARWGLGLVGREGGRVLRRRDVPGARRALRSVRAGLVADRLGARLALAMPARSASARSSASLSGRRSPPSGVPPRTWRSPTPSESPATRWRSDSGSGSARCSASGGTWRWSPLRSPGSSRGDRRRRPADRRRLRHLRRCRDAPVPDRLSERERCLLSHRPLAGGGARGQP